MPDLSVLNDAWVLSQRGPRNAVDPARPYAMGVEPEFTADGVVEDVTTIFLTNRECPFRCLMCDLWKNTTTHRVPDGAIAEQIKWALACSTAAPGRNCGTIASGHEITATPVRHVKLYNSGNFFDGQAIPRGDWPRIAELLRDMRTVIVESHPRLIGPACERFAAMLAGRLEVAMGLETVDPAVLPRLNKRMTLDDYSRATAFLTSRGIRVRAFILLRTPFQSEAEGVSWAKRSIEWAFERGVECCAVIPTRGGNGAMERLAGTGQFEPPTIASLQAVVEHGLSLRRGRVFADLWDIERLRRDDRDDKRIASLREMNLTQELAVQA